MSLADTVPIQAGLGQTAHVPILAEPFESAQRDINETSSDETPRANAADHSEEGADGKKKKRSLFGFGKKKTDDSNKTSTAATASTNSNNTTTSAPSPTRRTTASPINVEATHMMPSSPGRNLSSSSPRLVSPSGSQIFERDVTILMPNSPAIPSHIQTENLIPPVLDASSEAITDSHLDPDSVEIVTHTSHQLASTGLSLQEPSASASWADELANSFAERDSSGLGVSHSGNADAASNYGNLDNNVDIRRLSFISFADVVQAEQAEHGPGAPGSNHRDSVAQHFLTSIPSPGFPGVAAGRASNRSPSPARSPAYSPPTSKSGSIKGLDLGGSPGLSPGLSPGRKPLGSPTSNHHHIPALGGELNVETMTQALRRTQSGDLGGNRSLPTSPVEGPSR